MWFLRLLTKVEGVEGLAQHFGYEAKLAAEWYWKLQAKAYVNMFDYSGGFKMFFVIPRSHCGLIINHLGSTNRDSPEIFPIGAVAMAEEASLVRDVEPAKLSNETVTSPFSQKALKRVVMAVVPLAFLAAVCYFSMPGVQSVPSAVRDTVGLSGSTWWDPIEQCTKAFREVMDNDLGKLAFGDFSFETQELRMKDITTAKQAAEALQDPLTLLMWENAVLRTELRCGSIQITAEIPAVWKM